MLHALSERPRAESWPGYRRMCFLQSPCLGGCGRGQSQCGLRWEQTWELMFTLKVSRGVTPVRTHPGAHTHTGTHIPSLSCLWFLISAAVSSRKIWNANLNDVRRNKDSANRPDSQIYRPGIDVIGSSLHLLPVPSSGTRVTRVHIAFLNLLWTTVCYGALPVLEKSDWVEKCCYNKNVVLALS